MDSVTQFVLGAAVGGAVLGSRFGRRALLLGGVVATVPDLDVFLPAADVAAAYTEHRGFSHSLLVWAVLALPLAWLAARISRRALWRGEGSQAGCAEAERPLPGWGRWWCFFFLVAATHVLLDSLTAYGTQIFWPLPLSPVAIPAVFIIDPFYTLALLFAVVAVLIRPALMRWLFVALALTTLYLLMALGIRTALDARVADSLEAYGLRDAPRLIQPMPFNVLLWRVTVLDDDRYLDGAVSIFDGDEPPRWTAYRRNAELLNTAMTFPAAARLDWFTHSFLRASIEQPEASIERLVVTDIRLGSPGAHLFGFVVAERDADGDWRAIDPLATGEPRAAFDALPRMLERIGNPRIPACAIFDRAPDYQLEACRGDF